MKKTHALGFKLVLVFIAVSYLPGFSGETLKINELEYFEMPGLNVMVFHDFYPEGHQAGVGVIQNGVRVATNGDLRLSPTPGQWQPLPKLGERVVSRTQNVISVSLSYPDSSRHRKTFNPMIYPDITLNYKVKVKAEGTSFRIMVDLEKPLPTQWVGKIGFNIEFFPTILFGKTFYMDEKSGIFPQQANGPMYKDELGDFQAVPLAEGKKLIFAPECENQRLQIESKTGNLLLIDGRANHNNGWFVVRTLVPEGATKNAIEWIVTPHILPNWRYKPVVHVSQVGYHPGQQKIAIIEVDKRENKIQKAVLKRISESGGLETVVNSNPKKWGQFLRYHYLTFDFSAVKRPGMYVVQYGDSQTEPFKIGADVYQRHVWQPTLEYFLPIQMCHMRVNEKYRVWHGLCHADDALMAPVNINHFDGYKQGSSTLTRYQSLEHVPGLNVGGWHDAGDYDIRLESQTGTIHILSLAYEAFKVEYDQTLLL